MNKDFALGIGRGSIIGIEERATAFEDGQGGCVRTSYKVRDDAREEAIMNVQVVKQVKEEKAAGRAQAFQIETRTRVEFQDLTSLIQKVVDESQVEFGECHVFVPHTTAALLINENDDRALHRDLDNFLKELAPRDREYFHNDGNCDAHLKASLIGCSKTLFVEDRRLVLGRWQGIYFCEFDGPRRRELRVKVVSD